MMTDTRLMWHRASDTIRTYNIASETFTNSTGSGIGGAGTGLAQTADGRLHETVGFGFYYFSDDDGLTWTSGPTPRATPNFLESRGNELAVTGNTGIDSMDSGDVSWGAVAGAPAFAAAHIAMHTLSASTNVAYSRLTS